MKIQLLVIVTCMLIAQASSHSSEDESTEEEMPEQAPPEEGWRARAQAQQAFATTKEDPYPQNMNMMGEEGDDAVGKEEYPNGESKCNKAGYYSHIFEQDQYDLQNWQDARMHGMRGNSDKPLTSCKSASVNPRGTYTSHLVPCTFQFYQMDGKDELDTFTMSTACSNNSPMKGQAEAEQYVVKWPDECVADFARCYILDRDESILLRHVCKYEWKFPDGATHVSVDCTADKAEKEERNKNGSDKNVFDDPYMEHQLKHQRDQQREYYAFLFGALLVCLMAGCISLCFTYRYVIKPYLTATMKKSRSDPELKRLAVAADGKDLAE